MPLSYNQIVTVNNSLYRPYYIESILIIKAHVCGMTSSNGNVFRITGPLWVNPPVTGGFLSQRPVTRSFNVFFDLRLNTRLSKHAIEMLMIRVAIALAMTSL